MNDFAAARSNASTFHPASHYWDHVTLVGGDRSWVLKNSSFFPFLKETDRLDDQIQQWNGAQGQYDWPNEADGGVPSAYAVERYSDATESALASARSVQAHVSARISEGITMQHGGDIADYDHSAAELEAEAGRWWADFQVAMEEYEAARTLVLEEMNRNLP